MMGSGTKDSNDDLTKITKDSTKNNEQPTTIVDEQPPVEIPPIPVKIVSTETDKMKNEVSELFQLFTGKLKEALDLIPKSPGRLLRFWLWFQKHGFTTVCFIVVGIVVGIGIEGHLNHQEMVKAINLQCMEFRHNGKVDRFKLFPSEVSPYYTDDEKWFGFLHGSIQKPSTPAPVIPLRDEKTTPPTKDTPTKKGK